MNNISGEVLPVSQVPKLQSQKIASIASRTGEVAALIFSSATVATFLLGSSIPVVVTLSSIAIISILVIIVSNRVLNKKNSILENRLIGLENQLNDLKDEWGEKLLEYNQSIEAKQKKLKEEKDQELLDLDTRVRSLMSQNEDLQKKQADSQEELLKLREQKNSLLEQYAISKREHQEMIHNLNAKIDRLSQLVNDSNKKTEFIDAKINLGEIVDGIHIQMNSVLNNSQGITHEGIKVLIEQTNLLIDQISKLGYEIDDLEKIQQLGGLIDAFKINSLLSGINSLMEQVSKSNDNNYREGNIQEKIETYESTLALLKNLNIISNLFLTEERFPEFKEFRSKYKQFKEDIRVKVDAIKVEYLKQLSDSYIENKAENAKEQQVKEILRVLEVEDNSSYSTAIVFREIENSFGKDIVEFLKKNYKLSETLNIDHTIMKSLIIGLAANLNESKGVDLTEFRKKASKLITKEELKENKSFRCLPYFKQLDKDIAFLQSIKWIDNLNIKHEELKALQPFAFNEYLARVLAYGLKRNGSVSEFMEGVIVPGVEYNQNDNKFTDLSYKAYNLIQIAGFHGFVLIPSNPLQSDPVNVHVVFRGSNSTQSWIRNLGFHEKITYTEWNGPGAKTFGDNEAQILQKLKQIVNNQLENKKKINLHISGHSLGATDAQRMTAAIAKKLRSSDYLPIEQVNLYAFNPPGLEETTSEAFMKDVEYLKETRFQIYYFKMHTDPVQTAGQCYLGYTKLKKPDNIERSVYIMTRNFENSGYFSGRLDAHVVCNLCEYENLEEKIYNKAQPRDFFAKNNHSTDVEINNALNNTGKWIARFMKTISAPMAGLRWS